MPDNINKRSVLLLGKSQLVLDEAVAGLRNLGYTAEERTTSPTSRPGSTRERSTWSCSAARSRPTAVDAAISAFSITTDQ